MADCLSARLMRGACLLALLLPVSWPAAAQSASAPAPRPTSITIVQPKDQSTVFDNSGHVEVRVEVSPAHELEPGDRVELLLDGEPVASRHATGFAVEQLVRGEHRLQARVLDEHGAVMIESQPVVFYMWQASRNFPNRR